MRFLPIKGSPIKNEKTKAIVRKRLAFHIWLKAHEKVIPTNYINIHEGREIFEGKTFAEMVLGVMSETTGIPLFRHFKQQWSVDIKVARWSLSVHNSLYDEALTKLKILHFELMETYGETVNQFLFSSPNRGTRYEGSFMRTNEEEDDEDSWFDDDETVMEKAVIEKGFETFFEDDKSEVSWGTNNTKYTELVHPSTQSTNTSSLTSEILMDKDTRMKRQQLLVQTLRERYELPELVLDKVTKGDPPYRLIVRAIEDKVYDMEEVVHGIMAIYNSDFTGNNTNLKKKNKNE